MCDALAAMNFDSIFLVSFRNKLLRLVRCNDVVDHVMMAK